MRLRWPHGQGTCATQHIPRVPWGEQPGTHLHPLRVTARDGQCSPGQEHCGPRRDPHTIDFSQWSYKFWIIRVGCPANRKFPNRLEGYLCHSTHQCSSGWRGAASSHAAAAHANERAARGLCTRPSRADTFRITSSLNTISSARCPVRRLRQQESEWERGKGDEKEK